MLLCISSACCCSGACFFIFTRPYNSFLTERESFCFSSQHGAPLSVFLHTAVKSAQREGKGYNPLSSPISRIRQQRILHFFPALFFCAGDSKVFFSSSALNGWICKCRWLAFHCEQEQEEGQCSKLLLRLRMKIQVPGFKVGRRRRRRGLQLGLKWKRKDKCCLGLAKGKQFLSSGVEKGKYKNSMTQSEGDAALFLSVTQGTI